MSRERHSEIPTTPPIEVVPVMPPIAPNMADVELDNPLPSNREVDLDLVGPEIPRPDSPVESHLEAMESLEEEIRKAQLSVDRDKGLLVTMQGDEERLKDLIARRDALILAQEAPVELTPEPVVGPSPEPAGEAQIGPEESPVEATPDQNESTEALSLREVLVLQEEAFSARKEMINFRHGKRVEDLTHEEQEEYKRLRSVSQEKRKVWQAELVKLPNDQQEDLKDLTKLKQVQERLENLPNLTPEQILTESLLRELAEKKRQLAIINLQLGGDNEIPRRNVTALGLEGETKELRASKRALLAQIAEIEERLTNEGVAVVEPEPEPEVSREEAGSEEETNEPSRLQRSWSESKGRVRRMLKASYNELTRRMGEINDRISKLNPWDAWKRLQATREADRVAAQRQQIEDESRRDRVGFGTRFKESAQRAYRSVRNRLRSGETSDETVPPAPALEQTTATPTTPESIPVIPETPVLEQSVPRPEKGKSWKGWLVERTKGLFTFGIWEQVQARRFAKGTKTAAKDLENFASQIQKEQNLSLEDAMAEAQEIQAAVEIEEGEGTTGINSRQIERVSREITARKVGENNEHINETILTTIASLEDRLKKYKGVSGQEVLTEDAKNKIATEIQRRLNELRGAYIQEDAKELTTMLRDNLEPDWWKRVVYGGIESALWMVGGYVGYGLLTAGKETVGLQTTIWAIAKQQCIEHGISNPSNTEIMKVAIQLCKDSGVKVVTKAGEILWSETASGVVSDTALSKGFPVVISGAAKVIAAL